MLTLMQIYSEICMFNENGSIGCYWEICPLCSCVYGGVVAIVVRSLCCGEDSLCGGEDCEIT